MKKTKKIRKSQKPHQVPELPIKTIVAASQGDVIAVEKVLKHFEGFITVLSARTFYDEYGNAHMFVDEDKRRHLEIKLITNLLKYTVAPGQTPIQPAKNNG